VGAIDQDHPLHHFSKESIMTSDFTNMYEHYLTALREAATANSAAVFDALAAAGITSVTVEFDGEGDSGGVTSIGAVRGDDPAAVPDVRVRHHDVAWGETTSLAAERSLETAIEFLCYSCLEQKHSGWENDDGAYGTFNLTVADRRIALEFNARFTDVSTHASEF
jgi:hypothetical protein